MNSDPTAQGPVAGGMDTADTDFGKANRPFAPFEWMLALRYLRPRRKEAFISVIAVFSFLGIMLGVATLVVVMAVMNGFRAQLLDKILGINGHIILQPIESPLTDFDAVAQRIASVPGVVSAIPLVEGQALASGQAGAGSGVLVRGVREADIGAIKGVGNTIQEGGTLEGFDKSGGVAIGVRLAQTLGLYLGESITLISPRGPVTPMGVVPRVKSYPVVAIFEIGMSEYDGTFVFMPFGEAQAYFGSEGEAAAIEVYLRDPDAVADIRNIVEDAADRPVFAIDWRQRNVTFFQALEVERNVMFFILTLIVLVAALNIISGLTMLVRNKSRDIAILRTMGSSRAAVMRIFFITGASIGVAGTATGFLLGVIICWNIDAIRRLFSWITRTEVFSPELYFLAELPAEMDPGETATIVIVALLLSFLATLYPAWKAARLDPVEALRYE